MQPTFAHPIVATQDVPGMLVDAMANPGRIATVDSLLRAPNPLHPAAVAICYTCLDDNTKLWTDLDPGLLTLDWLFSVCGNKTAAGPAEADVVLITHPPEMPSLESFAKSGDLSPGRTPLLIIQTTGFFQGAGSIRRCISENCDEQLTVKGLPDSFWNQLRVCGTSDDTVPDIVFTCGDIILAIPSPPSLRFA